MGYRLAVMLADLLHPERVRVGLTISDKEAALRTIASLLCMPEGAVDEEVVYNVLRDRERLASTGIGSGVAIPHGRYDGVGELRAAVAVCPAGVDFDAVDSLPVTILVGIVGPRSMPQKHLAALAGVSRVLRNDEKREALLKAVDAADAYRTLVEP
ncbi:MAG: PTS sugar transporter subunit IIA [Deltaproteobacteria bacterium]|nr:PTS sugar transporter subunit IIA [Deltaproteobacteria bacterium]MBW2210558.1 PTS sugar transporter subunit IIA [Deltaproteobacteria bacterium]MBW2213978.1 PTS sugar transporter subunit IIA [Deltaproteobacteria bacterium]MBW2626705.1 PTS sugar transporter subunit IIA [Deltaproteobacteria bacterium]MBW2685368.1 PTS sugar transporter subunit IIA [Deltaproteobacteria bacterium]